MWPLFLVHSIVCIIIGWNLKDFYEEIKQDKNN